jgi:poly-gamma-glutamate capsule biosynthesis protein CapA/YwtB (metallophosphatase superfamily)
LDDEAFRVEVQAAALSLGHEMDLVVQTRPPRPDEEWVAISGEAPEGGQAIAVPVRYWAAFTSFWSERQEVSSGEVMAVAGTGAAPVYIPAEYEASGRKLLGPAGPAAHAVPSFDLPRALASGEDGVALLPVELASPRLRALLVDGADPLYSTPWPDVLIEKLWIGWEGERAAVFARQLVVRLAAAAPRGARVVLTGDIIPARCVYARHKARDDYTSAFSATADYLRSADIAVGSLDASLSSAGEPYGCEETFNLLAPPRSVEGLTFAGFDVLSVATNHIMDCGRSECGNKAFLETLDVLEKAGIRAVGGGRNESEVHSPAVIDVRGLRFAFLAYDDIASSYQAAGAETPGTAGLSASKLERDIAAAKQNADVVIVVMQWGAEYDARPTARQREFAGLAVQAGASLVAGSHAHVVQGVEWIGDAFVAYGLGNFVFDQDWATETQQGAVLEATFVGDRLAGVRLLPVRIVDMHRPTWASEQEARSILDRMRRASAFTQPSSGASDSR